MGFRDTRTLCVIPARGGSKTIPHKNRFSLGGKPLLLHCAEAAKKAKGITRIVVSTDDKRIAAVCRRNSFDVVARPDSLARDTTPTQPVIEHALKVLEKEGEYFDSILILQPTSPFVRPEHIAKALRLFRKKRADSVISVTRIPWHFHPYNARIRSRNGTVHFLFPELKKTSPNKQVAPAVYALGNLILTRRRVILDEGTLFGKRTFSFEVDAFAAWDIDTRLEMELAEAMLRYGLDHAKQS